MHATAPPFSCTYSPEFPEFLEELGCSLIISSFQANKVIVWSSQEDRLVQLPRQFEAPYGMALEDNRLAIACKDQVVLLVNDPRLAPTYPNKPSAYDAMFLPRGIYFTGNLALHDLAWQGDTLIGVNTSFSCLCRITMDYSFEPFWQPPFVTELSWEDRCHLNGVAMENGQPKYVTAFAPTNTFKGWRDNPTQTGVVIDVESGEIVVSGLGMPHCPRIINGELYLLLSVSGEIARVDPQRGTYEVINRVPGFARGIGHYGDYLFIGLSRIRENHLLGEIEMAKQRDIRAGVFVMHLPSGAITSSLQYYNSCEEIYEVLVCPNYCSPGILRPDQDIPSLGLSLPESTFWGQMIEM